MDIGYISSVYFLSLLRIIEGFGLSREDIFKVHPIDHSVLFSPKGRIHRTTMNNILDFAAEELEMPNVGLEVGYRFRVHTFTETGSILAYCSSLAEAAKINAHYQPLSETIGKQDFVEEDGRSFIVWSGNFDDPNENRHATELIMAGYSTTTNWLSWGFDPGVLSIQFNHDRPESLVGYEKVFGENITFGAGRTHLEFNPKTVNRLLPTSNPEKLATMRHKLDFILQRADEKSGLQERVAEFVLSSIKDYRMSFEHVARDMGMSERALRRMLKDEGLSYRTIVEDVRKDLCQTYMRDGKPFTDIAQLLAYNDQSAFTRAFKKWYGVTPTEYKPLAISL